MASAQRHRCDDFGVPSSNNPTGHTLTIEGSWATICQAAKIENLRVHDLPHSFASELEQREPRPGRCPARAQQPDHDGALCPPV